MGIPSYFSYIIKNYANIIRKFEKCEKFDHLFMDCNSIVYDAYNRLEKSVKENPQQPVPTPAVIEKWLVKEVVESIKDYLRFVSPTKTAYIAFDGVPPLAKMEQQRTRRYKTQYMKELDRNDTGLWNTTAITPGTDFMNALNKAVYKEFKGKHKKWGLQNLWVSCSDEVGEGEHKLFECLRTHPQIFCNDAVAVYGLDSDLIMLSIFHCTKFCKSIDVFRESPEFRHVLSDEFEPRELLFMNIGALIDAISREMQIDTVGVYDYLFMCFFLGNDFLPHFPAFNIRTHGIQVLTETYSKIFGKHKDRHFINETDTANTNSNICWKWVNEFVKELAKYEHDYLLKEYQIRDKFDKRYWTENTKEERDQIVNNTPVIYRSDEKYISPGEDGWETRYYRVLFGIEYVTENHVRTICMNYLSGLEWVFAYYTDTCLDWRWKYNYSYPPLMKDLQRYIGEYTHKEQQEPRPFSVDLQLAYVLPRAKLDLSRHKKHLLAKYPENYPEKYDFLWAFCRYFWEAHPVLPDLDIAFLETLERELTLSNE